MPVTWLETMLSLVFITFSWAAPTRISSRAMSGMMPTARIIIKTLSLRLLKKVLLRFKIITHSPFSIYIPGLSGIFLNLFPKPSYMNINRTDIAGIFISPHDA